MNVELTISTTLKDLGVSPSLLGFDYLKEAIRLVLEDKTFIHQVTKLLYPTVAEKFSSTCSRVERAMRHAIEKSFDRVGTDILNSVFGRAISADTGKLTNSEFIACVAEYLKASGRV